MPASARPNILVFMADQLPADFVRARAIPAAWSACARWRSKD